jgi:hypothetical protein
LKNFLKTKDFKIIILSSLIPIFLMILWQFNNVGLPIADANDFIGAAGRISNYFWNGEIFRGFYELYSDKPWRPVTFHLFLFPFMLVSKNNIIFTSACVHILCLFFIVAYSYSIFRKISDDLKLCGLAATATGLLSASFFPGGFILFAETAFTPAVLAVIYHLLSSNYMRNKEHSIYLLIAMCIAFTIRPVEAITYLLPIFIYFFYKGYKDNAFTTDLILYILKIILSIIFILSLRGLDIDADKRFDYLNKGEGSELYLDLFKYLFFIIIILFLSKLKNLFLFIKKSREKYKNYSIIVFSIFSLFILIWFYDSWRDLYIWIYTTQLGSTATSDAFFIFPISFKEIANNIFFQISWSGILPIALIYSLFLIFYLYKIIYQNSKINLNQVKYLFISTIIPCVLVFITISNTPRKFAATYIIIMIIGFLLVISFSKFKKILYTIFSLLVFTQAISIYSIANTHDSVNFNNYNNADEKYSKFTKFISGNNIPKPKKYSIEPKIIDLIYDNSKKYNFKNVDLSYFYPGIQVDIFQSSLLNSLKPNLTYISSLPLLLDKPYSRKWLLKRFRTSDAFFIINPLGSLELSDDVANIYLKKSKKNSNNQESFYEELLYFYLSGKLTKDFGFIKVSCIDTSIPNIHNENKGIFQEGCLLVKKQLKK